MKLNYKSIKRSLKKLNYSFHTELDKYQNKYYLMRYIHSVFPELPEKVISDAIDNVNNELEERSLTSRYIDLLSNEIISLSESFSTSNKLN